MKIGTVVLLLSVGMTCGCVARQACDPFTGRWYFVDPADPTASGPGIGIAPNGRFVVYENIDKEKIALSGTVVAMEPAKLRLRVVASECGEIPEGCTFTLRKIERNKAEMIRDDTGEKVLLTRKKP
jgi:hypothetical protein